MLFAGDVQGQVKTYTATGAFTYDPAVEAPGVTQFLVQVWGGGGAGGGRTSSGGAGGGTGGGFAYKIITITSGGKIYGEVGVGQAGSTGNQTGRGGTSWAATANNINNSFVRAAGGVGVNNNTTNAATWGTPSGNATQIGDGISNGLAGTAGNSTAGGEGGISGGGALGGAAQGTNGLPGNSGNGPGGGGGGAKRNNNGTSIGGSGGNGQVVIMPFSSWPSLQGSGSRDLFPSDAPGYRAALMSAAQGFYPSAYQFINLGVQKVYAKAGEKLYLGSSAQGAGQGHIRVYKPSNTSRTTPNYTTAAETTVQGRIYNRVQELAGPNINGTVATGYTPFDVDVDETGVWEVHFISPAGANYAGASAPSNAEQALVSAGWAQNSASTTAAIIAWDVTVASGNTIMPGRTFQNVFNTYSRNADFNNGFYGEFYVLTEDGYPYLVKNNGMQGIAFTFFVNNRGFTTEPDGAGVRTYKSINSSTNPNVKNPNDPDDPIGPNQNITHKIFYGKPGADLPASASYNGGTTWLKILPPSTPQAVNVTFEGVEGNVGYASSKGGYIKFDSNIGGTYRLTVPGGTAGPVTYYPRVLVGPMVAGPNTVYWDGKSGLQTDPLTAAGPLPAGSTVSSLKVQVFGAEVHFPFLDVEANANGIIIQQLDNAYNALTGADKDVVYWNDIDITRQNSGGINNTAGDGLSTDGGIEPVSGAGLGTAGVKSSINGHKWGMTGASSNGYGNSRAIDTYSFVAGAETTEGISVTIRESDLEVLSLVSNITAPTAVNVNDAWQYTVQVKNAGPTAIKSNSIPADGLIVEPAKFRLYVPEGITIDPALVTFSATPVGGESVTIIGTPTFKIDPAKGYYFEAELDMPINGTAQFVIPVLASDVVTQTGNGDINVYATILRPADFTDPDATNLTSVAPIDPFFEATGVNTAFSTAIYTNPAGVVLTSTNNIKRHSLPNMKTDLEVIKTAKQSASGNGVGSFTLTVRNNGTSDASGVFVEDVLSSRYIYTGSGASKGTVSYDSGTKKITWIIGELNVNESATMTFNTSNTGTTNRSNTAVITGDHFDPNLTNNTSTVDVGATTSPTTDLAIFKTVNGDPTASASIGSNVTFVITVKRMSGANVNNVIVKDLLPSGFTLIGVPVASQGTYNSGTGVWTVGTIDNATDRTLTITATVNASSGVLDEYKNVATIISTDNLDDDPTNNTASATVTLNTHSSFITNPMIYQRIIKK